MAETTTLSAQGKSNGPDYPGLVLFLVGPLLEASESLSVDWEQSNQNQRVWIRLAFEDSDRGRVYGRGGRNIQAIRQVLETAAATAGQSLYLDIYESPQESLGKPYDSPKREGRRRPRTETSPISKPSLKPRLRD